MMEGNEKTTIRHPEAWELLVSIEDKQVNYALFTTTVAGSLITGKVARADESLQALEDAVYDTPELLNDYKRVRIVIHSPHFVLLPGETSDEDCEQLLHEAFSTEDTEAIVSALPSSGVKSAFLVPCGMKAFLGRTFSLPEVYHHLQPLCEHFGALRRGEGPSRMTVLLKTGRMDLVIHRNGELQCANSYPFANPNDAAYFALNAWSTHGLDQLTDELHVAGEPEVCETVEPLLKQHVKLVMPAEFPAAAMRLGPAAVKAPLELILLALCE